MKATNILGHNNSTDLITVGTSYTSPQQLTHKVLQIGAQGLEEINLTMIGEAIGALHSQFHVWEKLGEIGMAFAVIAQVLAEEMLTMGALASSLIPFHFALLFLGKLIDIDKM